MMSDEGSNSGPFAREVATKQTELRNHTDTRQLYNTICFTWDLFGLKCYNVYSDKGVYRVSIVKRPLLSTLPFLLAFYNFKK